MTRAHHSTRPRPRAGFTLIESVMSILIVGLMLVAALNTVGASKLAQMKNAEQVDGPMLAEQLMSEILRQAYEEPVDTPTFGRESGESGGDRTDWDDVDDYDGHSSSPPEAKDGTALPGLVGWERVVLVDWVNPLNVTQKSQSETGIKKIRINVKHNNRKVFSLIALRTNAWPEYGAEDPLDVLMVVPSAAALGPQEISRKSLLESWGFTVEIIDDSAPQITFDDAATRNDVAYVTAGVDDAVLDMKLQGVAIGVVNECFKLTREFGFGSEFIIKSLDQIRVKDTGHYVSTHFGSTGYQTVFTSPQTLSMIDGGTAPDSTILADSYNVGAESNNKPSLVLIDAGGSLYGGGSAAGRRIQLPWGQDSGLDINALNGNGQILLQRSIEWAANLEQPD